jgi:hypothetical protein
VSGNVTREITEGGQVKIAELQCLLALKLSSKLPARLLNRHMDGEEVFSHVAESFGVPITGDPTVPVSKLYSGPVPSDGLKWPREPDDEYLVLGSFNTFEHTATSVWVFSKKRYLAWFNQTSGEPPDKVTFTILSYGNDTDYGHLVIPEGQLIFHGIGFRHDYESFVCVPLPLGGVQYWATTGRRMACRFPAYEEIVPDEVRELSNDATEPQWIKNNFVYPSSFKANTTQLTSLVVGYHEVHKVYLYKKKAVFERLGQYVELDLNNIEDKDRFILGAEWSYDYITLWATYIDSNNVEKRFENTTRFRAMLMPAAIAKAIWQVAKDTIQDESDGVPYTEAASLRHFYLDARDLSVTVANIFREVDTIFKRTRPSAFWNTKGKRKTPKPEPESGDTLRAFFEDFCAYKNIVVTREDPTRSGDVDFVFIGPKADGLLCQVVLEIKNAHSRKLEDGLTTQLPLYISDRQLDIGLYGVLWFKGRWQNEPKDKTIAECLNRLLELKPANVAEVLFLDVSFPTPASKR